MCHPYGVLNRIIPVYIMISSTGSRISDPHLRTHVPVSAVKDLSLFFSKLSLIANIPSHIAKNVYLIDLF